MKIAEIINDVLLEDAFTDQIESWGMYIQEKATIPNYNLYLVGQKYNPAWSELAFQQIGRNAAEPEEQMQHFPAQNIRKNLLKPILHRWLEKYPKIYIRSYNKKYLKNYIRILQIAGFTVTFDPTQTAMPAYYISRGKINDRKSNYKV